MDGALPVTIAIGAAVGCCVFVVGIYLTNPGETILPGVQSLPELEKDSRLCSRGFVGIIALLTAIGWNIDDSPRAQRDKLDQIY
jgi:hypothetical protein